MIVFWHPPPLVHQNGIIIGYQINISRTNLTNTVNITKTSYIATGLQIHTLYSFEVAARTSIGLGPFSDIVINQTFKVTYG